MKKEKARFVYNLKQRFPNWVNFNILDFIDVCPYSMDELKTKSRYRDIMQWRQVGMVWRALETGSISDGGHYFGHDHATCIHAIRCTNSALDGYNPHLMDKLDELTETIRFSFRAKSEMMEVASLEMMERRILELIK